MPNITLSSKASFDTNSIQFCPQIAGLTANVDIAAGTPVYIDHAVTGTDKVKKSAAGNPVYGVAATTAKAGQPVTILQIGARFHASDTALTAAVYYAGAAGVISDAATAVDSKGMFLRVSNNDLQVVCVGTLVDLT